MRCPPIFCKCSTEQSTKIRLDPVQFYKRHISKFRPDSVQRRTQHTEFRPAFAQGIPTKTRADRPRLPQPQAPFSTKRSPIFGQASHETPASQTAAKSDRKPQGIVVGQEKGIQNIAVSGRRSTRKSGGEAKKADPHKSVCTKPHRNLSQKRQGAVHERKSESGENLHESKTELTRKSQTGPHDAKSDFQSTPHDIKSELLNAPHETTSELQGKE